MTSPTEINAENLTFEVIKAWGPAEMKAQMRNPEMRAVISRILQNISLEQVEKAQAEAEGREYKTPEERTAEEAEAQRLAQEQAAEAERQRLVAEPVAPKKFSIDYQVKDDKGRPLGRPTHLEAASQEELLEKIKEAHIQAVRFAYRMKDFKVQTMKEAVEQKQVIAAPPVQQGMSDDELLAAVREMKSDDEVKAAASLRKVLEAERNRTETANSAKDAEQKEAERQRQVTFNFLNDHKTDYNNCEANKNLIVNFFRENNLPWTRDNLEIAFVTLQPELAPVVVVPEEPVISANPNPPAPPAAPAATATAPAATSQPAVVAPETPVPAVNPPVTVQPRPGVNTGTIPGQGSAQRPTPGVSGLTPEEIKSWDAKTMRMKMRNPQLRAEIEKVIAVSNPSKVFQTP